MTSIHQRDMYRLEVKTQVSHATDNYKAVKEMGCNPRSIALAKETLKFFIYCHNGCASHAQTSFDKMMGIHQDIMDNIMFGGEDVARLTIRSSGGGEFEEERGEGAKAILMGKTMMGERERLTTWLSACRYLFRRSALVEESTERCVGNIIQHIDENPIQRRLEQYRASMMWD